MYSLTWVCLKWTWPRGIYSSAPSDVFTKSQVREKYKRMISTKTHAKLSLSVGLAFTFHWAVLVLPMPNILLYTDKKENQIFLIYKEIQSEAVAKSYMRKGFLIYEKMHKYFLIYEEAVSHVWLCNCSTLHFLIYEENFIFFFISVTMSVLLPWSRDKLSVPLMIVTKCKLNNRVQKKRTVAKERQTGIWWEKMTNIRLTMEKWGTPSPPPPPSSPMTEHRKRKEG